MARPSGRAMGCLLWVQSLICIFALVSALMCPISCYTRAHYSGTDCMKPNSTVYRWIIVRRLRCSTLLLSDPTKACFLALIHLSMCWLSTMSTCWLYLFPCLLIADRFHGRFPHTKWMYSTMSLSLLCDRKCGSCVWPNVCPTQNYKLSICHGRI